MNNNRAIALSAVIVYALWATVLAGFITTSALIANGTHSLASVFALATILVLGIAAVITIRCYVLRVCGLIRNLHGVGEPEWSVPGLHTVP